MARLLSSICDAIKLHVTASPRLQRSPPSRTFSVTPYLATTSTTRPEPRNRYAPGGYHPVSVGEIYNKRYEIVRQLGWGQYSSVWLVKDIQNNRPAALKILTGDLSRSGTTESTGLGGWDELGCLTTLQTANPHAPGFKHICHLLDNFTHTGPNGATHVCLVLEAMEFSMSDVFRSSSESESSSPQVHGQALPLPLIKRVCKHTLLALQYLHEECGIVHTDIKDDNILVSGAPTADVDSDGETLIVDEAYLMSATFKLSDFGAANFIKNRFAEIIQPESLRAPEVIIGAPWDMKADIWNLSCLIYEFARGTKLFDPHWETAQSGMTPSQTHLAQIAGVCGGFPLSMVHQGTKSQKFFDAEGVLLKGASRYSITLDELLMRAGHSLEEVQQISGFLSKMLLVDPEERWSASQLLAHSWIKTA